MLDDLPEEIVPAVQAFAQRLREHVRTQRDASLETHEQGVLDAWRASAPAVLEGTLRASTPGLRQTGRPVRARCPSCGEARPFLDERPRTQQTRLGPIGWVRPWYHCRACRGGWSPTDQTLGIGAGERTSAGVRRWAAELGAGHTFAEAQALLADLTGVEVGEETLRTHAQQVGQQLEAGQQAAISHVQAAQEPRPGTAEPIPADQEVVVQTDGVFVRYRRVGFQEVKLGLVAGCQRGNGRPVRDPAHRPPELVAPSYVAARESAERFGPRLLAEAARRGALDIVGWAQPPGVDPRLAGVCGPHLAVLRRVQLLGDGAVWIWHLAEVHFGARREVVEWYYASQHLWTLAKALHGESPAATAWAADATHRLWRHGPTPLLAHLRQTLPTTSEAADVLRVERGYFTTNAVRMDYPTFRAQGLPIGSGAVESGAKHLVQHRFCRAGRRWSEPGAAAILALRTHRLSGRPLPTPAARPPRPAHSTHSARSTRSTHSARSARPATRAA